jgi:hypothetical protein
MMAEVMAASLARQAKSFLLEDQLQKASFCLECPLPSPASETTFPSEEAPQSKQKL